MTPSEEINQQTRKEWRELGFFYDLIEFPKCWKITGSRAGLLRFAELLREYSVNSRRAPLSEHDHYGPYMYLKIGTWSDRQVDAQWIAGTQVDLAQLADLVHKAVNIAQVGQTVDIGSQYLPSANVGILLQLAPANFDPAKADSACW